ncbi:hypothetical protein HY029_05490 [Candidatus Gottesmanbacteria bacterium]|nr:hypothetical protein [Candidatus Gottesmanbacteria bacterium]
MRYIAILSSVFLFLLLFKSPLVAAVESNLSSIPTPVTLVEYGLPYPGILPDHPLYIFKVLRDKILIFFTRDPIRKVNLDLLFADKRLAMSQLLWEKENSDLSISTIIKAEKYLLSVSVGLSSLKKQNNLPPGLSDKAELATKKHEEVITKLISNVSDDAKRQNLNQALGINHQAMQQILLSK